jgi:hypothetical protein
MGVFSMAIALYAKIASTARKSMFGHGSLGVG